jgi:hypothetical protein
MLPLLLFTGAGLTKRSRPCYLCPNDEGVLEDEVSIHQKKSEAVRKVNAAKEGNKAQPARARKGKDPRVNYKTMSSISYSALRQRDWYISQQRAVYIEDCRFWCMEQLYIYQDIFVTMKKPTRPMHPIDLGYLKSKEYFVLAVKVVEKLGLIGLMSF